MRLSNLLLALFAVLAFATDAGAASDTMVPGSVLRLSVVSRAHLSFAVDVTNPTDAPVTFDGTGLYFVPTSREAPPQRLGVVTPGHRTELASESWRGVAVPPYQTIHVTLTAYCLDVGRQSPADTTTYRLAELRLPAKLSAALSHAAYSIAARGYDTDTTQPQVPQDAFLPATAGSISGLTQAAVWRIRAQMPTPLVGETH